MNFKNPLVSYNFVFISNHIVCGWPPFCVRSWSQKPVAYSVPSAVYFILIPSNMILLKWKIVCYLWALTYQVYCVNIVPSHQFHSVFTLTLKVECLSSQADYISVTQVQVKLSAESQAESFSSSWALGCPPPIAGLLPAELLLLFKSTSDTFLLIWLHRW